MRSDRRKVAGCRALVGLLAVCGLLAAPRSHAAQPGDRANDGTVDSADGSIDDPKMFRRLGTRIDWASPPTPAAPPPSTTSTNPAAVSPGTALSPPVAVPPAAVPPAVVSPGVVWPAAPPSATPPGPTAISATAPAAGEGTFQPVLPRAQLAFRRFDFVRLGASDSAGLAASEAFDTLSLDVYPVSSVVRFGLSTAYGWQAGMTSGGDYFATETASLGAQLVFERVVPFAEALAGVGYLRRFQFDHTIPTVFWQLGVDLGAAVYFARIGFVSLAVGYLHPVNGFLKTTSFESVYTNTWSFKIGIGI